VAGMDLSQKTDSLVGHLSELRKRLIIILVVNITATFICYFFIDKLIQYILYLNPGMNLIYIAPSELFMVYMELALICAIVLCFPITISEIWMFISKGLYKKERNHVLLSLFFGAFFFVAGILFCYTIALPITLDFFMRISLEEVTANISVKSFVSFCNTMLISFGIVFELPVIVFLLSELDILKPSFMKKSYGVLVLIIFIVAAIITPPDVISQIVMAIPMLVLLEISKGICYFVDKRKKSGHK
jgi:sec-independent protein translocase protein TatC